MTYIVATHVTATPETGLRLDRVLTAGAGIAIADGGAGSTITVSILKVAVDYEVGALSNPPTQAELVAILGDPITVGAGTSFLLDDAGAHANIYLVTSDGFYFWAVPLAKTAYTEPSSASASNAASALTIPTHDGGGQAVHPGVVYIPSGWNGYKYWMAMTPYPGSNQSYEKPNVIASNDGTAWVVPSGLTNPINTPTAPEINSDAEIMLSPDGVTLWVLYRGSDDPTDSYDKVLARSSTNGTTWSAEATLLTGSWATMLSPAILFDGTQYVMWVVDSTTTPNSIQRLTCATVNGTWSSPSACTINNTPSGKEIWHLDIVKRGAVYHGFFVFCTTDGNGAGSLLYFATSTDGITWAVQTAVLLDVSAGWDNNRIYRSSGIPTAAGYDLFYSAMTTSGTTWHIGRTTVTLS